jgi:hypothetical protein
MLKSMKILSKIVALSIFILGISGFISGIKTMFDGADFGAWIFPFVLFVTEIVIGTMLFSSTYNTDADRFLVLNVVALLFLLFIRIIYAGEYLTRSAEIFYSISLMFGKVFANIYAYYFIAVIVMAIVSISFKVILLCKNKKQ